MIRILIKLNNFIKITVNKTYKHKDKNSTKTKL